MPNEPVPCRRATRSSPTCSCTATSCTSPPTCCSCGCSATTSRTPWGTSSSWSSICCAASPAASRMPGMLPASKLPLIGASGAVAGVIAAYLILHPRVLVWVLAFRFIPLRISAAWVLGVWVRDPVRHGAPQPSRSGRLVGAYRRHGRRRRADPVHAAAGRAAVRSGCHAGLTRRQSPHAGYRRAAALLPTLHCCPSVVQSAAPVAQLTPNCRGPTFHFALAKRLPAAVIKLDTNCAAWEDDRSAARQRSGESRRRA